MPVYERETVVAAPFEEVWAFHSTADGLEALTPDWMHLEVEATVGPDGEPDPEVLEAGSKVTSSVRPLGVGPRLRWTSYVVTRREGDGEATFRDEMVRGPFPEWTHTHTFEAVDGGHASEAGETREATETSSNRSSDGATRVRDRVEYRLPGGPLGRVAGPLGRLGLEPVFRYRHRRTKDLLE